MDGSIDIDELQCEINRYLPPEQQIQKNDPMFAGAVLNKVVLSSHVRYLHKKLEAAVGQITSASEEQTARAATISEKLIARAGDRIESQVDSVARHWEERLRKVTADGEASIRRACRLAWTGAILIFVCACIVIGSYMGTFAFDVLHHAKQRHR